MATLWSLRNLVSVYLLAVLCQPMLAGPVGRAAPDRQPDEREMAVSYKSGERFRP